MREEWSLSNDKAILNFSSRYCTSESEVIDSKGFLSILSHYLCHQERYQTKIYLLIQEKAVGDSIEEMVDYLRRLFKLLTNMDSKELGKTFPEYSYIYDQRLLMRRMVEEIYKYWRSLERYCLILENKQETGLANASFIEAKKRFDALILGLYRHVSNNISCTLPNVFRQLPAGTNVGFTCKNIYWPIPNEYAFLEKIPFITNIVLEAPLITYPKRNKRDGIFKEVSVNPVSLIKVNPEHFFCYPAKVGSLLAYIYVERDFITHGISLSNLFELATIQEVKGKKPDLLLIFGAENPGRKPEDVFFHDQDDQMLVGYISHDLRYDYFGYMKKMTLTLHNVYQIIHGNLPIHGAMVHIILKNGQKANVVIMGDSGAGKSESIEAFRSLADEHISDMTVIFDDMGTFSKKDGKILAYGTETGAFVRLDDLDTGYAFKELDRSIFMNPDKINARLINPVATYAEIMKGYKVDIFLYANNYDKLEDGDNAILQFKNKEEAKDIFRAGKRMAKGTTTEQGLSTTYFANPFGPIQREGECEVLLDQYFEDLFKEGTFIGTMRTQLGIQGYEKKGPERAALDLFDLIKSLHKEK